MALIVVEILVWMVVFFQWVYALVKGHLEPTHLKSLHLCSSFQQNRWVKIYHQFTSLPKQFLVKIRCHENKVG